MQKVSQPSALAASAQRSRSQIIPLSVDVMWCLQDAQLLQAALLHMKTSLLEMKKQFNQHGLKAEQSPSQNPRST